MENFHGYVDKKHPYEMDEKKPPKRALDEEETNDKKMVCCDILGYSNHCHQLSIFLLLLGQWAT